jgi:hypothetical protein
MIKPYDLGMLRILAGFWGLTVPSGETEEDRSRLAAQMINPELVDEIVAALPRSAAQALADLLRNTGRMPWVRLARAHGPLRQMGAARRERERPQDHPASGLETLYYRGLAGRAFFDTDAGPLEYGFIPDDILPLLPSPGPASELMPGRPARDDETTLQIPATDGILDDLTGLLAAVRTGRRFEPGVDPVKERFCLALLTSAGMLVRPDAVDVDRVRGFLEAPRGVALAGLISGWLASDLVDEIDLVPDFEIAAGFPHDPVRLRSRVLSFIDALPERTWWSLGAFPAGIEALEPEFLRPAGELDSRYIKDRNTGEFLDVSAGWEAVEGAFIRWLVAGPLHWLGLIDLAAGGDGKNRDVQPPAAFRVSPWNASLRAGAAPVGLSGEGEPVHVRSDGRISVPRLAPRVARYLIARFCDWEDPLRDEYRYRATPGSLQRAGDEGLKVGQLIALLVRHAEAIPPNLTKALKSWEQHGRAGRIEVVPVLRLPSPEALDELRRSRAARFLGDTLGPAAVALKPGSEERVLAALNELGYLAEIVGGGR